MDIRKMSLDKHYEWKGKIEVVSRVELNSREDLSLAYTPGVAQACLEIEKEPQKAYELTRKANLVAVITDGSAVLGLGDIGPSAAMPVMEGKCVLFKQFAGVDAFPLCVDTKDTDELVHIIAAISKSFGGINLEDIAAPRCFEVERRLKELCDIPVFHDDQHGTAIVAAAALTNAMKVTGRQEKNIKIVINGAGAAGTAIAELLLKMGFENIVMCDIGGIIHRSADWLTEAQQSLAQKTNPEQLTGTLADAMRGADVMIGVSKPGLVSTEMVASMNCAPILFAMANPTPEIMPEEALRAGAAVVGTGRSDFPNQINNVLAFPGVFKGALRVRAKEITDEMKAAAAMAIATLAEDSLSSEHILPDPLDPRVADAVADAVAQMAMKQHLARI